MVSPGLTLLYRATINLGLQGLNLLGKALLLLILTRFLPVEDVGLFGLLAATLTLSLLGLGLGFRWYSVRELVRCGPDYVPRLVRDQMVLHALSYALLLPGLVMVFLVGVLPWSLAGWFYALLVLDHLNEELYRVLVILSRTIRATLLLVLRQAAWVYAVAVVFALGIDHAPLQVVLGGWVLSEATTLVLAIYCLRDLPWRSACRTPVDWPWIGRGLLQALPLMSANLAFSGMNLADRYALEFWRGLEQVGVYSSYSYVRNAIGSLLEVGVLNLFQPQLIAAYQEGRTADCRRLIQQLLAAIVGLCGLLCALAALLIHPVLVVIDRPIYGEHLRTFWMILVLTLATAVLNLPLLVLYARHADRQRLVVSLMGLTVAIILNVLLVPGLGMNGAVLATLGATGVVGAACFWILPRTR
jgi:O-antigen/teichoic acid export membrane protein